MSSIEPQTGTIGWLRIVHDTSESRLQVGLFTTTTQYEPVAFTFGCLSLNQNRDEQAVQSLTRTLIASTLIRTNDMIVGVSEDLTSAVRRELSATQASFWVPVASIDQVAPLRNKGIDDGRSMIEFDDQNATSQTVSRIFEGRNHPYEPLVRTVKALGIVVDDSQVSRLIADSDLQLVLSLPKPDNEVSFKTSVAESTLERHSPSERSNIEHSLSKRLWSFLAMPIPPSSPSLRDIDPDWWRDLMPFQRDGVKALIEMDRLLLADDMGLGKTVQAIVALRILVARHEIQSALVVAPAGLLDQWRSELTRWAPELTAIVIRGPATERSWQWRAVNDVTLVSYETLRSDESQLVRLQNERRVWGVVVLDEAQRIKNRNRTSDAAKTLVRKRSWALTGTPIENDEEDLASIMEFVDHEPGTPGRRFRPGFGLITRHRELQLRRKKADVLSELPPKLETKLRLPLTASQRESYDLAESEGIVYLKSLGSEVTITHVLELITRLKQICNIDPRSKASSKLEDVHDRIEELTGRGHKALVFSQYTSEASGVRGAAIHLQKFKPLLFTGDMPMEDRREVIRQFHNEPSHNILILSLRAGGLGLNLQTASYVFHLDRWWNPAIEQQAEDRTHRMGQSAKVNVFKYCCADTIEERIDQILERKRALFDELVDDVSIDLSTRLSRDELLELFDLSD